MKIVVPPIAFVVLLACNNTATGSDESKDSILSKNGDSSAIEDVSGCYRQVIQRDTVLLQLQQSGSSVKGTMAFDNYQKDSSHGTVEGSVKKDTVVLWYDFFSEGMHSVMEIVLKKTKDGLVRGFGPVTAQGDTSLLQSHNKLQFDSLQTLRRINCNE